MGVTEQASGAGQSITITLRTLASADWATNGTACETFLANQAGDTPVPGIDELLAQQLATGRPLHLIEINNCEGVLALIPLLEVQRTVKGLPLRLLVTPGDDFFDYLPLPLRSGVCFSLLLKQLRSVLTTLDADALLLQHLLPPLPVRSAPWQNPFRNQYFDAALAEKGWAGLTRKESLRRHRNRARRDLDYRVEHIAGHLPADLLARIAELHRERWAFDGVASLFADASRLNQYLACAERALLTLVFDGQVLFAAHIGLRFGSTMIWHTPVINLRYLAYSPLEVLLLETAEQCAATELQVLDFGLGDETYKGRFSNATRQVVNLFVPCTWRAYLAHFLLHRSGLNGLRQWLTSVQGKLTGWCMVERGDWLLPASGGARIFPTAALPEPISEFSRLVDLFRAARWPLHREHHERLRRGEVFVVVPGDEASGLFPAGVWCQVGSDFPAGAARFERHFDAPTATFYDITGAMQQGDESCNAGMLALLSSGSIAQLVPAAADAGLRIRLPRGQPALRAALLAAGCQSA